MGRRRIDALVQGVEEHRQKLREEQVRNSGRINAEFLCFAKSPAFPNLAYGGPDRTAFDALPGESRVVAILGQDRLCDRFQAWIPGKSPEKHEEMTLLEKVREENRQAQARADLKAQERDRKEDARHWRTVALSVAAIVVSFAIGIANFVFTMLKK